MMFHEIAPKTLTENVFSLIGDRWMLITAGTPDHCNTMTASWGGLGVLWRKPMATIYVRPQRYTFVAAAGQAPYIQEADLVLVCKKRYWNDLDPAHMDAEALQEYKAKDYHRMYLGEITQVLVRD